MTNVGLRRYCVNYWGVGTELILVEGQFNDLDVWAIIHCLHKLIVLKIIPRINIDLSERFFLFVKFMNLFFFAKIITFYPHFTIIY